MATAGKRKEPAVISIALLTHAIEEEANLQAQNAAAAANSKHHHHHGSSASTNENNNNLIARPPIQISEATSLQLSFRSTFNYRPKTYRGRKDNGGNKEGERKKRRTDASFLPILLHCFCLSSLYRFITDRKFTFTEIIKETTTG